ncbi:MAG TPA: LamG-like jellyroll fold domain-containing protein, partial [Candidatus Krumholzibacterium sp.]|nr:LamG-like jellyroll fold domain-containing protein [Candidatus Krumholzibacterium sp.]
AGEWTHVGLSRDINAQTVTLYINGALIAVEDYLNNPNGGSESRAVFGECGGCVEDLSFLGALDEVYFFAKALDAAEILAIYEGQ